MIHKKNKVLDYVESLILCKKQKTGYQEMNEPEKILQAIDDIVGRFCLPVCPSCGQDRLEHLLKSEGGGIKCMYCNKHYYMMMDSEQKWGLIPLWNPSE